MHLVWGVLRNCLQPVCIWPQIPPSTYRKRLDDNVPKGMIVLIRIALWLTRESVSWTGTSVPCNTWKLWSNCMWKGHCLRPDPGIIHYSSTWSLGKSPLLSKPSFSHLWKWEYWNKSVSRFLWSKDVMNVADCTNVQHNHKWNPTELTTKWQK